MAETFDKNSKNNKNRRERKNITLDFYEVFGLPKTATKKEIIIKYRELAKKYHPDKNPLNGKIFEVIQRAWECLSNDEKRKKYDEQVNNQEKIKKTDHFGLKKSHENFMELKKEEVSEEKKNLAVSEFKKLAQDFDSKIGYDRTLEKEILKTEDTNLKINDIKTLREQDEIEYSQPRIFSETDTFDPKLFNKVFEKYSQKNQIIKKESGPSAFNDNNTNFSAFDVFDDPFGDKANKNSNIYSSVDILNESNLDLEITAEDLKKIRNESLNTTFDTHNSDKLTENDFEKILNERKMETEKFNTFQFNEFKNNDKSNMFLHNVDNLISGSLTFEDNGGEDDEDLVDACNRLIELEKGITGPKN